MSGILSLVGGLMALRGCYALLYQNSISEAALMSGLALVFFLVASESGEGEDDENS